VISGCDMMQFWSSGDGTGSRVEKKLKTIDSIRREIEEKRAAVSTNSTVCFMPHYFF
jgi:hypothetical protein